MQALQLLALLCLLTGIAAFRFPVSTKSRSKLSNVVISKSSALYATPASSTSVTDSSAVEQKRVYTSRQTIIDKIIIFLRKLYKLTIGSFLSWFIALFKKVKELKSENNTAAPKENLSTVMKMWQDESKISESTKIADKDDASMKVAVTKVDENQWVEKKLKEIETLEVDTKASVAVSVTEAEDPKAPYDVDADATGPYDVHAVMVSNLIPSTIKVPRQSSNDGVSFDIVKSKGTSGIISYVITEVMFWALVIPIIIASYHGSNQEWLNFGNSEDRAKILALAGVYVTSIRLAVPLRLGVAVAIIPWVEENITNNFFNDKLDTK